MERLSEMFEYVAEDITLALNKQKKKWMEEATKQKEIILKPCQNVYTKLEENEKCLVISYLRSSYITGSHQFKAAIYAEEPFVEVYPAYEYISMKPWFVDIEKEVAQLAKKIAMHFIRLKASETEELRRYYWEQVYQSSVVIFEEVFKGKGKEEKNFTEQKPNVFFGEEMGEIHLIGTL